MNTVYNLMVTLQGSTFYWCVLMFFAGYPIVMSLVWITTSLFYRTRWEHENEQPTRRFSPRVSVLIPAHNEASVIGGALEAACKLDYPAYEVVVVDDGSTDETRSVVEPFVSAGKVRLITKAVNEGKAMAMNDALSCLNGEIILIMDADAEPEPHVLKVMVPHFASGRVAAVTGNPRVKNVDSFLARLQLMEFTSIVSLLRRSQRVWGRIVTVSGVVAAFRKSALLDAGRFSPDMPTEDIDLTWKIQKRFWDVRYEPSATVWMTVPRTFGGLFRQRLRWAQGLMHVLQRHRDVIYTWKMRRMWPIFVESSLSTLWSLCFVVLTTLWCISVAVGYPPVGVSPVPNFWGMTIATLCMTQLLVGTWMDRKYDREIVGFYPYAVFYPIVYWMLMAICNVLAMPRLVMPPPKKPVRWTSPREAVPTESH